MDHIAGNSIVKLMRKHGKSIRGVATSIGITQKRVRRVREHGIEGVEFVQDWMKAITGDSNAGWAAVARAYA